MAVASQTQLPVLWELCPLEKRQSCEIARQLGLRVRRPSGLSGVAICWTSKHCPANWKTSHPFIHSANIVPTPVLGTEPVRVVDLASGS